MPKAMATAAPGARQFNVPWEDPGGEPNYYPTVWYNAGPGPDVLLLNDRADWLAEEHAPVEEFLNAGRGLVVLHNALADNNNWPSWYRGVTGGLQILSDHDGLRTSVAKQNVSLRMHPSGQHPITQGIQPLQLSKEEAVKGMWQAREITPLLETDNKESDKVVAWIGIHPKARVVCIQAGTSTETHAMQPYRMLIHNSVLWAAGRLS